MSHTCEDCGTQDQLGDRVLYYPEQDAYLHESCFEARSFEEEEEDEDDSGD